MIYITGDCHGDFRRFSTKNFPEQKEMAKEDYVIICGDFGGIWNYQGEDANEKHWLDWLNKKSFTTLFVCGNHECFPRIYSYPVEEWNGGKVHKIRPSVMHLMRGEVFEISGKKIFAFGGASSHDIRDGILDPVKDADKIRKWNRDYTKLFRIDGVSWWKEELPSMAEMLNGLKNLKETEEKVDYIVSHCAPQQIASIISGGFYEPDSLTRYFNIIAETTEFDRWFFGHYHDNRQVLGKFIMLYEQITRIA